MKELIKEKKFKYIYFFWMIISIQFVIGTNLQNRGYSIANFIDLIISVIKILILNVIFVVLHYCVLELYKKVKIKIKNKKSEKVEKEQIDTNHDKKEENGIKIKNKLFIYFLIIIVCWIPTLLAFYPTILNYDAPQQIVMFTKNKMTADNPILSTILMGGLYTIGFLMNNTAVGMFLYSVVQMSIMAIIFAYAVKFIEKKTHKKWIRNVSIIFYALFPYNQLFPLMTTKDTLFAGLVLFFIILLYEFMEEKKSNISNYIYVILIGVLMLLFRNNAVYAFVATVPFLFLILFKNKKQLKKILVLFFLIIVFYQISYNVLLTLTNAKQISKRATTSIFSQAIGKLCREKADELTDEEKEEIDYYFQDYKLLAKKYKSNISDTANRLIMYENIEKDKMKFANFMIGLGKKYPMVFVDSCLNTIRGYWYISDNSFCNIYKSKEKGCLELTFSKVYKNGEYDIKKNSYFPALEKFYKDLLAKNYYLNIPILYIVFQPGFYLYILLACLLYSLYIGDKNKLIGELFLLLYFLTCFLGPCAIIRYIYAVIVCVPILVFGNLVDKELY